MGLITVGECDVFKSRSEVEQYVITVRKMADTQGKLEGAECVEVVTALTKYLCPKALKRLNRFIERGTSPPGKTKPPGKTNGNNNPQGDEEDGDS